MDFKEALKRFSYGIGRQLGSQFAESLNSQLTAGYDAEELARGIIDEVGGQNLAYSQEELNEAFRQYGEESKAIAEKRYAAVREEGEAFLRVNPKRRRKAFMSLSQAFSTRSSRKETAPGHRRLTVSPSTITALSPTGRCSTAR